MVSSIIRLKKRNLIYVQNHFISVILHIILRTLSLSETVNKVIYLRKPISYRCVYLNGAIQPPKTVMAGLQTTPSPSPTPLPHTSRPFGRDGGRWRYGLKSTHLEDKKHGTLTVEIRKLSLTSMHLSRWTTFLGWTGPIEMDCSIWLFRPIQSQSLAVQYFPCRTWRKTLVTAAFTDYVLTVGWC